MLLTLLIEVRKFKDQYPEAHIQLNGVYVAKHIRNDQEEFKFEVKDSDCVQIIMLGKGQHDTEIVNNNIISDKAVILKEIKLEGCVYPIIKEVISYTDPQNNILPADNYMHANGIISIKIKDLVETTPIINDVEDLTFEQMAIEVLGRPTTINPKNSNSTLPKDKNI